MSEVFLGLQKVCVMPTSFKIANGWIDFDRTDAGLTVTNIGNLDSRLAI